MKTILFKHNKQQLLKWRSLKNYLDAGRRDWPSLFSSSEPIAQFMLLVQRSKLSLKNYALANKVAAFLATIQGLLKSTLLNDRIYSALVIFCFSPLAACIHMRFNRKEVVPGLADYHENYFHLFNLLGPYIFCLVVLIGSCLLIPKRTKTFKVFKHSLNVQLSRIMFIPIGYTIAKLIWLYYTKSNEDFWSIPNWSYFAVGLFVGYIIYLLIEWLMWRKYHAFDGIIASIEGLYKIELPEEIRREKVLPLIKELKEFSTKY